MPRFLIPLAFFAITMSASSQAMDATTTARDGWTFVTVRDETAPKASVREDSGGYGLVINGNGEPIADGRWVRRVEVPAGEYVSLSVRYRARDVEMVARNVIAAVAWLDEAGKEAANTDYADTRATPDADGWRQVNATFKIPAKAKQAQIELRLRWSPSGEVEFRDAQLQAASAPTPRRVKVATIHHRPRGLKSAQENLEQFAKWIDEAGQNKADIVCLPEAMTLIGRGSDYLAASEPIPGPSTDFLGKLAAKHRMYIVAGLLERDGKGAFNTSVLIDRGGKLAGKYRKVCLPGSEYNGGLAPGSEYPVFTTDFGRVGMMICWDVSYPEVARELAAGGAEILFMPIWGGNETLCKARAIENQVPLVTSSYDLRSAIYDQAGEPLAQASDLSSSCVVYAEMNLAEPMDWKWTGKWRDRIWVEGPVRKDAPADSLPPQTSAK